MGAPRSRSFALALGGGAARGLAHIGVLEVLEREGLKPGAIVGTSMGALVGALYASGLRAREVMQIARGFRFPRRFIPGGMLDWSSLFGCAIPWLSMTFERLETPLLVTAVDLEIGSQVILATGNVLPAVQASSTVPGVIRPVKLDGRWLVDGGIFNVLPVDVAWIAAPDLVVGVDLGGGRARVLPQLERLSTRFALRLGQLVPNPATAKVALEMMVRATEIMLDRQSTLAASMTAPDLVIRPVLGDIGLRDLHRLDEAVSAGRRAAEIVVPRLRQLLEAAPDQAPSGTPEARYWFDPVCAMVISPATARAICNHAGKTYHFCSPNCRDAFEREPVAYVRPPMPQVEPRP